MNGASLFTWQKCLCVHVGRMHTHSNTHSLNVCLCVCGKSTLVACHAMKYEFEYRLMEHFILVASIMFLSNGFDDFFHTSSMPFNLFQRKMIIYGFCYENSFAERWIHNSSGFHLLHVLFWNESSFELIWNNFRLPRTKTNINHNFCCS